MHVENFIDILFCDGGKEKRRKMHIVKRHLDI